MSLMLGGLMLPDPEYAIKWTDGAITITRIPFTNQMVEEYRRINPNLFDGGIVNSAYTSDMALGAAMTIASMYGVIQLIFAKVEDAFAQMFTRFGTLYTSLMQNTPGTHALPIPGFTITERNVVQASSILSYTFSWAFQVPVSRFFPYTNIKLSRQSKKK